jgi:hypothetical protein
MRRKQRELRRAAVFKVASSVAEQAALIPEDPQERSALEEQASADDIVGK